MEHTFAQSLRMKKYNKIIEKKRRKQFSFLILNIRKSKNAEAFNDLKSRFSSNNRFVYTF